MNQLKVSNASSLLVQQAKAVASAIVIVESTAAAAVIAAEKVVSASAAASTKTLDETLQIAKKVATETLEVAKKVAEEKLLVAKEQAYKTLAIVDSVNQELGLRLKALDSISQGILITDASKQTTYLNKAIEEITGYSESELMGKGGNLLEGLGTDSETMNELRSTLDAGLSWHGEILNYRKSGTPFWNDLSVIPIKDDDANILNFVGLQKDISSRKTSAEKIEYLAFYDHLTDLPNRRLLIDRLNHAFSSSQRSDREGAVLFIDLDNFKDVNDTFGHNIGDLLIQQIAIRLGSCMRAGDTVARLGGDEFVVVLEALSVQRIEAAKQVNAIGEKILAALNKPYQLETHEYRGSCSIGAVLFYDHKHSAEELLKRADIALFRSKNAGRNTLTFFNQEMQDAINERVAIGQEMRIALEGQQFILHYQRQVDSEDHILGAEALIRWQHPQRGLLSPAQFISLAEEEELILPIGQWVLEAACAQLKAWEKGALTRDLILSVNTTAKQFHQVDFVAQIKTLLKKYDINPKLLKLELTESTLLKNTEDAITLMNTLREIGVRFSLDDFGTGYSSLQYLKRLPITQIKIDQSFIRDIVTDGSDKVIVRTIVVMAQSLGVSVIAEGVEREGQRQLLLDIGCTQYQGFLFGRPMPIDKFEASLRKA